MLENLTIIELKSYLTLCEANLGFLDTKRKLNPTNKKINEDFDYTFRLRNNLYDEINKRLRNILSDYNEAIE